MQKYENKSKLQNNIQIYQTLLMQIEKQTNLVCPSSSTMEAFETKKSVWISPMKKAMVDPSGYRLHYMKKKKFYYHHSHNDEILVEDFP